MFKYLLLLLTTLFVYSCKQEDCNTGECSTKICKRKVLKKENGYKIYEINQSFAASKSGPVIIPQFDVDCDGKVDFQFNSYIQMYSPGSGWVSASITPIHEDAFLFGEYEIDTTFYFTDTVVDLSYTPVWVRASYGTTCSSEGVNVSSYSTQTELRLPLLVDYEVPETGAWYSEPVNYEAISTTYLMSTTETPDTIYYSYKKSTNNCSNFTVSKCYILFKVGSNKRALTGFFEMNGATTIASVGVKVD
jgi:hypothetical protein